MVSRFLGDSEVKAVTQRDALEALRQSFMKNGKTMVYNQACYAQLCEEQCAIFYALLADIRILRYEPFQ